MHEISLLISADQEWHAWIDLHPGVKLSGTPFGHAFQHDVGGIPVLSFQGGWGKISAAASTQWLIDQHEPSLILNLGTCGGIEGRIDRSVILLINKTIVYDIQEQMSDAEDANRFYESRMDLAWLDGQSLPQGVERGTMLSADRDLLATDVSWLVERYAAQVVDWESASIAWVCRMNRIPLVILRGVSDLVNRNAGETYGNLDLYIKNTRKVMKILASQLPWWIEVIRSAGPISPPV